MAELTFGPLSVPYLLTAVALVLAGAAVALLRGDPALRLALLTLVASVLPWSLAFAVAASTRDEALATAAYRLGLGGTGLVGPGLLLLLLGAAGRFERHRGLVVLAFVAGLAAAVLTWATPWTVRDVRPIAAGVLFPRTGWGELALLLQIPLWGGVGWLMIRAGRRARRSRDRGQRRRAGVLAVLASVAVIDPLLATRVDGWVPLAWVPVLAAALLTLHGALRRDLLRARGVDRAAAVELAGLGLFGGWLLAIASGGSRAWGERPLVSALLLVVLPLLAVLAAATVRLRLRGGGAAGDAAAGDVGALAAAARDLDEAGLVGRLAAVLAAHTPVTRLRAWALGDGDAAVTPLADAAGAAPALDARVRAWLVANPEPLVVAELARTQLGGLRGLVERAVDALDGDVLIPLVDRDRLVAVAVGELPEDRVLRDAEREVVRAAASAAARGLALQALDREAAGQEATAREVEMAEAVAAARGVGDLERATAGWRLCAHYRPAARVAGDVWTHAELGDGRLVVVVAEATGNGVASALVSAAVVGAADAAIALAGDAVEPAAVLATVHRTVAQLAGGAQRVAAFAAVLDRPRGELRYACAGHRGGWLVRAAEPGGEARARVEAVGGASTPLGEPALALARGVRGLAGVAALVVCSDGVVELRDRLGEPWGERRLQRLLREQLPAAPDRAARNVVAAALAHAGEAPVADDLLALAVLPADA